MSRNGHCSSKNQFAQSSLSYDFNLQIATAVFFLINLCLGIIGTFWMQTKRRTEESGIMRAFGATKRRIMHLAGTLEAGKLAARLPGGKEHARLLEPLGEYLQKRLDKMVKKETARCKSPGYVREQQRLLWRALFRSDFEARSQALGDFLQKEHVQTARYLCQTFRNMLAGENRYGLYRWIDTACVLGGEGIRSFAEGVRKDYAAIKRAIDCEYNNGLLEGTVCKIKAIKRVMYGRASFKLLEIKCTKRGRGSNKSTEF
ncbi:MAG: transposase [Prevotella sp.]|nr:transposase [Prevotella sp.]